MASEKERLINRSMDYQTSIELQGPDSNKQNTEYIRPLIAEFFGVAFFVCISSLCIITGFNISIAVAHGFTIALLVVAFGEISGAHLNPSVTFAALLAGAVTPVKASLYMVAQMVGGLVGAGLTRGILPAHVFEMINGGAHNLGHFSLNGTMDKIISVSPGEGILCEIVLTSVLVLTVLMSAVDPYNKSILAPLAIGFAVTVDVIVGALVSGASMNPARSFGPAVAISYHTLDVWKYHYVYWVGPAIGACVAALLYRLILANPEKRFLLKEKK